MDDSRIDFPEVSGKTVAEVFVNDDPVYGREVVVHFTDQTELSISVAVKQTVDARYCREGVPEPPLFSKQG